MGYATLAVGAAIGAGVAAIYLHYRSAVKKPKSIKLTYFDIKAAPGEKIRLALALNKVSYTDNRIKFPDWEALKPKTKYGQMPFLTCDGEEMYQSGAILRWAGRLGGGKLYPADSNPALCFKIEEMIGLAEDLSRAWSPSLYLGMGRHTSFGHPKEWPAKDQTVKELREKFVTDELPKYATFISQALEATGAFVCGAEPTIADCHLYPTLEYFTRGVADHVPKDCLDKYPAITAYLARFKALPEVAKHYGA